MQASTNGELQAQKIRRESTDLKRAHGIIGHETTLYNLLIQGFGRHDTMV
jgi:hypothetical protein